MKHRPFLCILALLFFCMSCAVGSKGILLDTDPGTPVDERDLQMHCDLGDYAACFLSGKETDLPPPRFPILQGLSPSNHAVFAVLIPAGYSYSWFLYDRALSQLTKLHTVKPILRGKAEWALQRIDISGLVPGRTYELLAGDTSGQLLDLRRFQTLPSTGSSLKVALLAGLAFASPEKAQELTADLEKTNANLVIFSGGNVSVLLEKIAEDSKRKDVNAFLFERHASARSKLPLGMWRDLVPVTSLWNELEYGKSGGNRTFQFRDQSREALELFFPFYADEESVINGPGLSKTVVLAGKQFALIDDLSFRSPDASASTICEKRKGSKTPICKTIPATINTIAGQWGSLQMSWLAKRIQRSESPTWLLGAAPFLFSGEAGWSEKPPVKESIHTRPWLAHIELRGPLPPVLSAPKIY